ncbi:MAG: hypothetical protein IPG68_13560 [Micrococcales bacterium]|nr:hypothetical protein [Micrococcales bacterium]
MSSEVLWQWVNSPATGIRAAQYPSENIRRLRRAVAVAVYRTWFRLGITERNLGASLPSLPGVQRVVSAFTAEQIQTSKTPPTEKRTARTTSSGMPGHPCAWR